MPLTFHIDIASTEGLIFSGRTTMVIAPTSMGELGILPRHAPLLARLKPGAVRVLLDGGDEHEESFSFPAAFSKYSRTW